ncbi:restriction endonuclease subunit S [Lactobacillus helveticus]|nr:restriction endonuclease subunit S [Lactobacillus helveticus]
MALLLFTFFVWEQRKLGEISNIIAGGDKNINKIKKYGKYPVIANSINKNGIVGYYDNEYRVKAPAVTVTGRGEIGHAVARFQNFTPIVRLLALSSKLDPIFLANSINKIRFFNESTGVPQLTKPQLSTYSIIIPSVEEQNNIGKLILLIEKYIHLHQRKLESFQFTYHEIIRRLFLKKAKWQQTKLSDLVTILDKNRKPVKKEDRLLGDTPYYGANGIQDYISGFTHKGEFILIAEDGANSLTEYPIYFVKGQIWVNNHAHVLKVNRDVSPLFLALALKQINYSKYTVGSSRNKLNLKDLENITIFIPDNNEQQKIGQFYSNYLNYLRINKKRIQYMKQFKQFLLQNMFI